MSAPYRLNENAALCRGHVEVWQKVLSKVVLRVSNASYWPVDATHAGMHEGVRHEILGACSYKRSCVLVSLLALPSDLTNMAYLNNLRPDDDYYVC